MKNLVSRILLIVFSYALFSCISDSYNDKDKPRPAVFHYNQPDKITSLDPAFAKSQNNMWAVHHIFNGLVQLDKDLELQACIAKSWDISDDGLTYMFNLRSDVLFHDNQCFRQQSERRLTAKDVKYSFERIISDSLAAPGSWIFKGKVDEKQPFSAPNDSTFVLRLKQPFLPMLNILSMQYCSITSRRAIEFYGPDARSNPVGTGPFKLKRWLENQGLYLVKNPDYFEISRAGEKLPYLDGVRTSFMEDKKIAFLELLNGKVECVSGLESSFINEMLEPNGSLKSDKTNKINLYKSPYLNLEYLGFNMESLKNTALADKRVRQALNYAIDRETMLQSLRNNIGRPADSGVIPKGLPSYNRKLVPGYSYQPQKAKDLLKSAGFPNGNGIKPITIYTNKDYLDLTTYVAKQWENIGVKTNISLMESASLRAGMRKGTIDIFRASWIADYPDAENFLCLFYGKNGAPPRYTRYQNDAFDDLYEASIQQTDLDKRTALYHEMNRMIVEDAPVIFLFYDESALFTTKNVVNVETNGINLLQVKQLKEQNAE